MLRRPLFTEQAVSVPSAWTLRDLFHFAAHIKVLTVETAHHFGLPMLQLYPLAMTFPQDRASKHKCRTFIIKLLH